ncbi:MAG: TetR/AcrR family transcriptional regulator [Erythrobacter sp.]
MARPDLKKERTEQILSAFDRCVARSGFAGVTLEDVAKEAGVARALIRHNVGNREDLEDAAIERFFARSSNRWTELFSELPEHRQVQALCERLLDTSSRDDQLVSLTQALMAHAANDAELSERLSKWLDATIKRISDSIRRQHPDIDANKSIGIAGGILGVYFNLVSFQIVGDLPHLEDASRLAIEVLLEPLG